MNSPAKRKNAAAWCAEIWILAVTVLLPLKFGTIAVIPEATSFFPGGWFDYCIISWPAASFGIAAGLTLLAAVWAWPPREDLWRGPAGRIMLLWCFGLPLASCMGMIHATTWDFPLMQIFYFLGIGAWAGACCLYVNAEGKAHAGRLLTTLTIGTLLVAWFGVEQYFWGFQESRDFIQNQIAQGIPINPVLLAKAADDRVYATFTGCNSLAGYLLLALPLAGLMLWRAGGRVEPVPVSRILFLLIGLGGGVAVLLLTKSRAAYLALFAGAAVLALCWPMRHRFKLLVALLLGAGLGLAGLYIYYCGRGFESMVARLDYLRSSLMLWGEYPWAGCGWGEFFFEHMRLKVILSDEAAHDPHNFLMTMTQAGSLAAAVVLAGVLYPILHLIRRYRGGEKEVRVFAALALGGIGLFLFHASMDIDIQIPALMGTLMVVFFAAVAETEPKGLHFVSAAKTGRGMAAILILWGGLAIAGNAWMLRGEMAYDRLLSLCQMQNKTPEDAAKVTPDQVQNALREAVAWRPYSSFPYSAAADYNLVRGLLPDADRLLNEALARAPKRAALYQRKSEIATLAGRPDEAARAMEQARNLFPNNPKYQTVKE